MFKIVKWILGGGCVLIGALFILAVAMIVFDPMTGSAETVARRLGGMSPKKQASLVAYTLADEEGLYRNAYDKVQLLGALRYAEEHNIAINYDIEPVYMYAGGYFITKYGDIIYEEPGEKIAQDILMHSRRKDVIERTFALYRRNEEVLGYLCDAGGSVASPDEVYMSVYREKCMQN